MPTIIASTALIISSFFYGLSMYADNLVRKQEAKQEAEYSIVKTNNDITIMALKAREIELQSLNVRAEVYILQQALLEKDPTLLIANIH